MKDYFCRVVEPGFGLSLLIYIGYKDGDKVYILQNNTMKEIDPLSADIEPTLSFSRVILACEPGFLRSLVDGLIKFGVKPSEPIKNNEELKAVKYHLEDMRSLVFKKDSDVA